LQIDIPLEAVLSVDKSPTMEFADTIEITVVDSEDSMAVDSYFFAYFRDNDKALRDIQDLLTRFKQECKGEVRPIRDSTDARRAQNLQPGGLDLDRLTPARSTSSESSAAASMQNVRAAATEPTKSPTSPLTKIAARINPFASSSKSVERSAGPSVPSSQPLPSSNASNSPSSDNLSTVSDGQYDLSGSVDTVKPLLVRADSLTYPPSRTVGPPPPGMEEKPKWGTSWLKPSDSNTTLRKSPSFPLGPKKVTEVFSSVLPLHKAKESSNDESSEGMEYSILEKSETGDNAESEVVEKFHRIFALEDKEVLLDREHERTGRPLVVKC
jgi:sterol 3beta-glucosyltransferase